jgi:hypothetical protein
LGDALTAGISSLELVAQVRVAESAGGAKACSSRPPPLMWRALVPFPQPAPANPNRLLAGSTAAGPPSARLPRGLLGCGVGGLVACVYWHFCPRCAAKIALRSFKELANGLLVRP